MTQATDQDIRELKTAIDANSRAMTRQIIKEIRLECLRTLQGQEPYTAEAICVVRSNCYGCSVSTINQFAAVAKQTYPDLKDEDIRVVQFGGESYARTYGIEFKPPDGKTLHDGWRAIHELEKTL
jgi:hypothetical protein